MIVPAFAVAAVLSAGLLWRAASRRREMPCPNWLGWVLANPYTNAIAGSETILDRVRLSPGMRLLDVGAGRGRVTIPAAERVGPSGQVVALDIQDDMLRHVRIAADKRGLTNVRTLMGSASSFHSPGCFDRILLVTVLGEIPDREDALQKLNSALKADGLLSVTEMIPDPHYQSRHTVRLLAESAGFAYAQTYGTWLAFTMNFRKRGGVTGSRPTAA